MWLRAPTIPLMEMGGTDGPRTRTARIPTFAASGLPVDPDDVRAHGKDERIGVSAFDVGAEHCYRLLRAISQQHPKA